MTETVNECKKCQQSWLKCLSKRRRRGIQIEELRMKSQEGIKNGEKFIS